MNDYNQNIWPKELWALMNVHFDYPGKQLTREIARREYERYMQMTLEELEDRGY